MKHHYGACQGGPDCNCDDYDMENNDSEPTTNDTELGSTALFAAFDAKIRWCDENAKECYECREEDCSDIGKYYDAAKTGITRFRNELFPEKPDNAEKDSVATVRCPECRIKIGSCWANGPCPGCGHFIKAND